MIAEQPALLAGPQPVAMQPDRQILPLRTYQQEVVDAILEARERGVRSGIASMPTGSGKTVVAAHLVKALGMPTVFMVHRNELVQQTIRKMQQINPRLSIGVVKAEQDDFRGRDLVIVSAQTVAHQRRLERVANGLPKGVLFISDECHHDAAPSRTRAIEAIAPAFLIGLSATPNRADRLGLDHLYQEVFAHIPMLELMRQGMLAPLAGLRIETAMSLDDVHTRGGEFVTGELADAVNTPARNSLVVESWRTHAAGRMRTVAFCVDVQHALDLRDAFRNAGVNAETIVGDTDEDERRRIFTAFHKGNLPVLTNCMVLTEGYDEPAIDCVLMVRPTKSQGLYIQCVGRAARLSPETGKDDALVIDFVDVTRKHQLVTLPSLAGEALKDRKAQENPERLRKAGQQMSLLSMANIEEKRAVDVDLFAQSVVVWREAPNLPDVHFAAISQDAYVVLANEPDGVRPWLVRRGKYPDPPTKTPLFDRALDFGYAAGVAERIAHEYLERERKARTMERVQEALAAWQEARGPAEREVAWREARNAALGEAPKLYERTASWRTRNLPPSAKQLEFAARLKLPLIPGENKVQLTARIDEALFAINWKKAQPG